ncbi:MAG TPA: ribosome-associated translation inhibitor RaiA [Verrucomicrobiae bacterium]|nr:ribosome-associated translation inhibitor RaiA [Verrucomicrobiae bacterium]
MIASIAITGVKYDIDATTRRYAMSKIGNLDRYIPRHARKSVSAEIRLKEVNRANGNKYECEVILHVPDQTLVAKDSTVNMLAAVDIVEEKLKNQLKKYKDEHSPRRGAYGILGRFKRNLGRS